MVLKATYQSKDTKRNTKRRIMLNISAGLWESFAAAAFYNQEVHIHGICLSPCFTHGCSQVMIPGSFYALLAGFLGAAASLCAKLSLGADYVRNVCESGLSSWTQTLDGTVYCDWVRRGGQFSLCFASPLYLSSSFLRFYFLIVCYVFCVYASFNTHLKYIQTTPRTLRCADLTYL